MRASFVACFTNPVLPSLSMVGSTIMDITYAIDAKPEHDPYIDTADIAFREAAKAGIPGAYLVSIFPFLKNVPDWMPGKPLILPSSQCPLRGSVC